MMQSSKHHDVRTTLTLDEDVDKLLRREMLRTGHPWKDVVNHLLRLGLQAARKEGRKRLLYAPLLWDYLISSRPKSCSKFWKAPGINNCCEDSEA